MLKQQQHNFFNQDAIREISRYKTRLNSSNDPSHGSLHYGPTMELVKEFRAQRNFYISGTSLFLWLYVNYIYIFFFCCENFSCRWWEVKGLRGNQFSKQRTERKLFDVWVCSNLIDVKIWDQPSHFAVVVYKLKYSFIAIFCLNKEKKEKKSNRD